MSQQLLQFHLNFPGFKGKSVQITLTNVEKKISTNINMFSHDKENWFTSIPFDSDSDVLYGYKSIDNEDKELKEYGDLRRIERPDQELLIIHDVWKDKENPKNIFLSSAFKDIIFKRENVSVKSLNSKKRNILCFKLESPDIPFHYDLGVTGNKDWLGNWDKIFRLEPNNFPNWQSQIEIGEDEIDIEYKYVLFEPNSEKIVYWETGENRKLIFTPPTNSGIRIVHTDHYFNYYGSAWKGSGVAIPVFSLRSEKGFGIGEFQDLQLMMDFAHHTGMKVVQTLPINDTIANKNWKDSYPYSAISVFALHPLYVNVEAIAKFKDKTLEKRYNKDKDILNKSADIDFVNVLEKKLEYLKILFDQEWPTIQKSRKYKKFIKSNPWLTSYSAFSVLRDRFGTANFNDWPEYSVYSNNTINALLKKDRAFEEDCNYYSFIQFHAHEQLINTKQYGVKKGVVLKGDLPIGIYRYSCDAWIAPKLYNMNEQAGAPPDSYSVLGQNWGFPTYNWDIMAKDNYHWWQERMIKLSEFFDALRIDHILGFFRIWQIPLQHIQGTLGLFNPRNPYSLFELNSFGLHEGISDLCIPEISEEYLNSIFGNLSEKLIDLFLVKSNDSIYKFNKVFPDQRTLLKAILDSKDEELIKRKKAILSLMGEVLLIEEPDSEGQAYNPRITLQTTNRYQRLPDHIKHIFDKLYYDYYFIRHDEYWKQQALQRLPALLEATNMLICGEDLGMIPASVPEVMRKLNIIPLEIQRMPKGRTLFGITRFYPYFSVSSPSCHDMSTIRGWWEGDENTRQKFYNIYMNRNGIAPKQCDEWIVEFLVQDHLNSNSILTIFPIQDLLGMDGLLKRKNAFEEQINDPSNSEQQWKYRMHINLETLLESKPFIEKINIMNLNSGRSIMKFS